MSNQRIVSSAYFVFGVILFVVLNQLMAQIWVQFQLPEHRLIGPVGIPLMIAVGVTALISVLLLRHDRVNPFLLEVVGELREVTWPTRQETTSHTMVVIVTVVVLAVILGAFDVVWAKVSKFILNPNI